MDRSVAFSLVIPAFDEAARLPRFLEAATAYLASRYPGAHEILVVDDGSRDETAMVAARAGGPVRVIRQGRNTGKGAAVRTGMLAARGALRLFADADGSTPIAEERRLARALDAGYDVAVGSRAAVGGVRTWVWSGDADPTDDDGAARWRVRPHRHWVGRVFARLVNAVVGTRIADTQCGFKSVPRRCGRVPVHRRRVRRMGIRCRGAGAGGAARAPRRRGSGEPDETPGSKVRVLRDGPRMLLALWEIRRRCAAREAAGADRTRSASRMIRRRSAR